MSDIWRVSFIGWVGNRDVVAEGTEPEVREAVHPYLEARMAQGYSLADLLPWLDWELVEA
ncbi:MAG: hypothetical protein JWM80_1022 [Cyanobacteria bacterium RYN_339]|nr:hypothetical protein [Cyanobacteria bacterium RYN_339]